MSSKWQILQSSSSDSSAWNHKINFRFSFDDYKRRVKYAIKQRRSRGGAFPIVEELNEDSSEDDDNDSQYSSVDRLDSHPHDRKHSHRHLQQGKLLLPLQQIVAIPINRQFRRRLRDLQSLIRV